MTTNVCTKKRHDFLRCILDAGKKGKKKKKMKKTDIAYPEKEITDLERDQLEMQYLQARMQQLAAKRDNKNILGFIASTGNDSSTSDPKNATEKASVPPPPKDDPPEDEEPDDDIEMQEEFLAQTTNIPGDKNDVEKEAADVSSRFLSDGNIIISKIGNYSPPLTFSVIGEKRLMELADAIMSGCNVGQNTPTANAHATTPAGARKLETADDDAKTSWATTNSARNSIEVAHATPKAGKPNFFQSINTRVAPSSSYHTKAGQVSEGTAGGAKTDATNKAEKPEKAAETAPMCFMDSEKPKQNTPAVDANKAEEQDDETANEAAENAPVCFEVTGEVKQKTPSIRIKVKPDSETAKAQEIGKPLTIDDIANVLTEVAKTNQETISNNKKLR